MSAELINGGIETIPTFVQGPAGTVCVDPSIFSELAYVDDTIKLGVCCFIAGLIVMWLIERAYERWG